MTADPRSDIDHHQRFTMPHSQPPPGTDAPLAHEDADALDSWLNAWALAQPPHGGPATPATNDTWPNGQITSARQFHARFAAAEEAAAPDTPVDAIWEQIMANTLIEPAPPPSPAPLATTRSQERRSARHPLLIAVGSHPAATALLVAGVILAIVFVFRTFAHDPNAPIIDYGPAAMIPAASPTTAVGGEGGILSSQPPTPSPVVIQLSTPDENGCIIRTLSAADRAAIDDPAAMPTPDYTVDGPLNSETIARDGFTAWKSAIGCGTSNPTLADNQEAGAVSNNLLATVRMGGIPETRIPLNEQRLAVQKALSDTIITQDPTLYTIDSNDPGVASWLITSADGKQGVVLPQDFLTFADGRIGAPVKLARPGGSGATSKESFISPQTVTYVFFRQVDGVWLIDEQLTLCTWKCDEYFAARQRDIDADRDANGLATPETVASPVSTASPVADVWLQPITKSECDTPIASPESDHDAAAVLGRQYFACGETSDSIATLGEHFFSDDLLQRHPEIANGQLTNTEDDVARSEAITTVVAASDIQYAVTGIHGATDDSPYTDGFYQVFLPDQNTIMLADGRFAIPITGAYPFQEKTDQMAAMMATAIATGDAPEGYDYPVTIGVLIFSMQDGSLRIDDALVACLANCDGFWKQQHSKVGTPSPSNEQLATREATASAVAAAKQPIPASECVVPTVSSGAEDLPTRSYVPPMQPTDANAAAVNQVARSFIACIEASPSPEANTPPIPLQEVLAPFETDRLRAEREAADPSRPVQPTDEQITAGESLSSYLESQGITSFAERAPAGVVDPGDSTWPATTLRNGQFVDSSPGWYTIPMPNVVFQFPDGRIGIPSMMMVTNDDLWSYLQAQPYRDGSLWIFAKVGDQWLMDEGIALCIGDCDAFWAEQKADQQAVSEWLQPVQASECTPVSAATYRDYVRPRDYMVVNTRDRRDAVARQGRAYAACLGWDTATPQASRSDFATSRHATEDTRRLSAEQIAGAKELSAYYTDAGFSPYQRAPEGVDFRDAHTLTNQRADEGPIVYTPIFDPETAVGLSDGRIAMPTTYLIADDRSWNQAQGQPLPITTTLTIWANVGGTWLIDEELPLCIGNCDSLWTYLESRVPDAPVATPTIPASPEALSYLDWLAGPGAGDCKVPAIAGAAGLPDREYFPWTKADASTGEQVALTDRTRLACSNSQALIPNSGFYTNRYELPPSPRGAVDSEMLTRMQDVSAAIPNQDPTAWMRLYQTSAGGGTKPDTRYAVLPENVYQLPDGRYAAIPIVVFEGVGTADNNALMPNGYLAFPVSIYVHSGDTWQLDEQVSVCLGDCTSYWSSFRVFGAPPAPGTPSLPATPVAATTIDHRRLTTSTI